MLAKTLNLEVADLQTYEIDPNAATLVDHDFAFRHLLIPIAIEDDRLVVAMADPANVIVIDDMQIMTGYDVQPVVSTEGGILGAIEQYCQTNASVEEMMESVADGLDKQEEVDEDLDDDDNEQAPVVKLVNLILTEAIRNQANDVHIEPCETDVRIRFRIDGVLHENQKQLPQLSARTFHLEESFFRRYPYPPLS